MAAADPGRLNLGSAEQESEGLSGSKSQPGQQQQKGSAPQGFGP